MVVFIVLWPYLITTKLRCWQKNNIGHTTQGTAQGPAVMDNQNAQTSSAPVELPRGQGMAIHPVPGTSGAQRAEVRFDIVKV